MKITKNWFLRLLTIGSKARVLLGSPFISIGYGCLNDAIGVSETFSSENAMENAISSVMRNAPLAEISTAAS